MIIDLARCTYLAYLAVVHHRHSVRHGESFFLVVGDKNKRDAGFVLQAFELNLHFLAKQQIKGGQRLIK